MTTVPQSEIKAAMAEFQEKPWSPVEVSAAIANMGSVLFNATRAPNALNPKVPESVSSDFSTFLQSCIARSFFNTRMCNALLTTVNTPLELQLEFLKFFKLNDAGNVSDLKATHASAENPYNSMLMVKYMMSHAHPEESVRQRCSNLLQMAGGEISRQLDETVMDYCNKGVLAGGDIRVAGVDAPQALINVRTHDAIELPGLQVQV